MKPKIFFRTGIALILLVLAMPVVFSFDCNQFSGQEWQDCMTLSYNNEDLIASLIYPTSTTPNHDLIDSYNSGIIISGPPLNVTPVSKDIIKDVWVKILTISPSVLFKGLLFVPSEVKARTEYSCRIEVPPNFETSNTRNSVCKVVYSLQSQTESLSLFRGSDLVGSEKISAFEVPENSSLKAQLLVSAVVRADESRWKKYCC
ncbi:hypothetical protein JW711_06600, partial [Candidatus Woesearchaeota archaeon]|nr:hypothetical protein [Candidatus Woesearchaeota archaeon]